MALPPSHIRIKRRRDEEPVDSLYIHTETQQKRRRVTEFIFRRVQEGDDGPSLELATTTATTNSGNTGHVQSRHSLGGYDASAEVPTVRTSLPGEELLGQNRPGTAKNTSRAQDAVTNNKNNHGTATTTRTVAAASIIIDGPPTSTSTNTPSKTQNPPRPSSLPISVSKPRDLSLFARRFHLKKSASSVIFSSSTSAQSRGALASGIQKRKKGLKKGAEIAVFMETARRDGKGKSRRGESRSRSAMTARGGKREGGAMNTQGNEKAKGKRRSEGMVKATMQLFPAAAEAQQKSLDPSKAAAEEEERERRAEQSNQTVPDINNTTPPSSKAETPAPDTSTAPDRQKNRDAAPPAAKQQPQRPSSHQAPPGLELFNPRDFKSAASRLRYKPKVSAQRHRPLPPVEPKPQDQAQDRRDVPSRLNNASSDDGSVGRVPGAELEDEEDDEDDENTYVYDTYIRHPINSGTASTFGLENMNLSSVNANANANDNGNEYGKVGVLIITQEDAELWSSFAVAAGEEGSDSDWDVEGEDENAEDYYANDYPSSDLASSDDGVGRGTYAHHRRNKSDDEEFDHVNDGKGVWSDDDDDDEEKRDEDVKYPWRKIGSRNVNPWAMRDKDTLAEEEDEDESEDG